MAGEKKYNWANWDIKKQPKIELENIPEEPKKERTASERQEEIDNIKAAMLRNKYWYDNYRAIDNLSPKDKAYYKPKVKPYGRFRSYIMDHKSKIILSIASFVFLGLWIMLLVFKAVGFSLEPTGLFSFLAVTFLLASFFFTFLAVEGD